MKATLWLWWWVDLKWLSAIRNSPLLARRQGTPYFQIKRRRPKHRTCCRFAGSRIPPFLLLPPQSSSTADSVQFWKPRLWMKNCINPGEIISPPVFGWCWKIIMLPPQKLTVVITMSRTRLLIPWSSSQPPPGVSDRSTTPRGSRFQTKALFPPPVNSWKDVKGNEGKKHWQSP